MSGDYLDFEIHVHRNRLLSLTVDPGDIRASVTLSDDDPLGTEDLALASDAVAYGQWDDEATRRLGSLLFGWLLTGDAGVVYRTVTAIGRPVRYRLIVEPAELAVIPWELLHDPTRNVFLALDGPFVRGPTIMEPSKPLKAELPLRVLVVDAVPLGSKALAVDEERDAIAEAFGDLGKKAEVVSLSKTSLPAIENALREAEAVERPFHVLHFMGHGLRDPETGKGAILLEDRWGRPAPVGPSSLAELLRPHDLRLVFLNACDTADVSTVEITDSFAPSLLKTGIPAVIGMQTTVFDDVARSFSQDFYESLVDNRPVDAALADARRLAKSSDPGRPASLGIPVAYLRSRDGQIAELIEPPKPPWWRSTVVVVAGVVGFIASILAIWQFLIPLLEGPERMTGHINVAVAEFGAVDAEGRSIASPQAFDLSHQVFDRLATELADELSSTSGFDIETQGPDDIGKIAGATREQRAERAADLAEAISADVIIYGVYREGSGSEAFQPEFYLSDRRLTTAEELVGQYELGREESYDPDNIVSAAEFRDRIVARAQSLSRFVVGLAYYTLFRYEEAGAWFEEAYQTPGWDERDGKEILLLFLGNTAAKAGDYDTAEGHYASALELSPEYSRAHVGAADIPFQRGRKGDCPDGAIDNEAMAEAIAGFERAREATFRPPLADIDALVSFGLGRVFLCQSLAETPVSGDVEAQFQAVIVEYEAGNERLAELASESWGLLGLYHVTGGEIEQGLDDYETAIDLAPDPERRGILECNLGGVLVALQRYDEAVSTLEAGLGSLEEEHPLRPTCQADLGRAEAEAG